MTGIDTNVLVRYIVRDDPDQASRADRAIRSLTPELPGFVSLVALAETVWVLRSYYRMPKAELILCIERLLNARNLILEGGDAVRSAVDQFAGTRCDFADCLIEQSGALAGCRWTVTFDADAARLAGMKLL